MTRSAPISSPILSAPEARALEFEGRTNELAQKYCEVSVHDAQRQPAPERGTPAEVFLAFLRLGLTSFGGPVAHLGYFHQEFVVRRRWLTQRAYADLVALCQFLPGPASSQVGLAI